VSNLSRSILSGAAFWTLTSLAVTPALAQLDLSGEWAGRLHNDAPERGGGPELGDFTGLPINDAARLRADSYNPSLLTLPEWQCRPHPADYMGGRAAFNIRFTPEINPATQQLVAWHARAAWMAQERVIWMDGRPHPSEEGRHTWQGFSTGKWEGNVLTVTTTHLKMGFLRRNGVARSDRAVLTEHYFRHGDMMTVGSIVEDPAYLTEPLARSVTYFLDTAQQMTPYPCESVVEIPRPEGVVPHYLPGTNPFLNEFATRHNLPLEVSKGGAEQMYPDYRKRFRK